MTSKVLAGSSRDIFHYQSWNGLLRLALLKNVDPFVLSLFYLILESNKLELNVALTHQNRSYRDREIKESQNLVHVYIIIKTSTPKNNPKFHSLTLF